MNDQSPVMIVTGSGRGIGEGIAELAVQKGYAVIGVDMSFSDAESTVLAGAAEIGTYLKVEGDVSSESTWNDQIIRIAEEKFARIDVLVNNAGISPKSNGVRTPSSEMTLDEWNRVLTVNLTGVFLGCRSVYPLMSQRRFGRIINISSQAAREGARIAGLHYGATKAADLGVTRTLAHEWGGDGITVNAITPGRIVTGMSAMVSDDVNEQFLAKIPVGRLGYPDDIAAAALFLASPEAAFVTGAVLDVNGGSYIG